MPGIAKEDLQDLDVVDAVELLSDGTAAYQSGVGIVTVTAATRVVVVSGGLVYNRDNPVEAGDLVTIAGNAAAGDYTVDEVTNDTTFKVVETPPADGTGGTATFYHPPGATKVGVDDTGLDITASNVQDAIAGLDSLGRVKVSSNDSATGYLNGKLVAGSGVNFTEQSDGSDETLEISAEVTEGNHRTLRHLIHFIDDGPAGGFTSGAYKEILPAGDPFPTSIIWWESSAKLKKIVEKTITVSGVGVSTIKPTPIEWKMYDTDGVTVLATVSDAITYQGVFEVSRVRTIT